MQLRRSPPRAKLARDRAPLAQLSFRGFPFRLPANGEPVFFGRGGASFCARRIGDEVCLLVTRMPMEIFRRKLGGDAESG